jgi:predicted RNA-binding protein with PUA-like domain
MAKRHWLMKTEPSSYSIDDLKREKTDAWSGVRNYQARNFMWQGMQVGDPVLFYHSSVDPAGVAGLARVASAPHPDLTQFDRKSPYFEPRATKEKPVWWCVDVAFVRKFPRLLTLEELRGIPALAKMVLLQRGSRLSVQPATEKEFTAIVKLASGR